MEIRQPVSVNRDYAYFFVVSQVFAFNTRPVANGSGGFGKYILESIRPYFEVYFFISGGLVWSKYVLMWVLHLRTTIYLSLGARSASFILDIRSLLQKRTLFWQVPSYSGQVFFLYLMICSRIIQCHIFMTCSWNIYAHLKTLTWIYNERFTKELTNWSRNIREH